MTAILGPAQIEAKTATDWAYSRGATDEWASYVIPLYWDICKWIGVRPEVAAAQGCKETGFGRFGGVINRTYNNPCGMKKTSGGGNSDPEAHQRFPTWEVGVLAQVDHLAIYAGCIGYPKLFDTDASKARATPDPRHFSFIFNRAGDNVEALGGNWAPSPTYGESIVNDYLNPMINFVDRRRWA